MDTGRHARRRTFAALIGTAAVVAAVIGGTTALFSPRGAADTTAADAGRGEPAPTSPPTVGAPPGITLVGYGRAAIAVPESWGRNELRCGTPLRGTVVIDVGGARGCGSAQPDGVDSISLWQGTPGAGFEDATDLEIDGVPARRTATTCERDPFGDARICSASVHLPAEGIPAEGVTFSASSATSRSEVGRILSWIRIVPDLVGVPGFADANMDQRDDPGATYVTALEQAGFAVTVRTEQQRLRDPGSVLDVSPRAGTMARPGDTVTVTVAGEPDGPGDELIVGMGSTGEDGRYGNGLSDEQVRAGEAITLDVGDRLWAFGKGEHLDTLAGELDGDSIELDDWKAGPNYGRSWIATAPGRSRITLSLAPDGERIVLGVVTVIVR